MSKQKKHTNEASPEKSSCGQGNLQNGGDPRPTRESQLAALVADKDAVCAHVYDQDGYSEYLFHRSPENIANFIGSRPMANQIVLTDTEENPFLWTIGYFIDRCPDKVMLEAVLKELLPIQMGEREPQPVFSPSMEEAVAYLLNRNMRGSQL